jgi:hypothetical protein
MSLKEKLLDLFQQEYEAELDFMSSLTEADRASGSADDWTPRDVLAHILSWKNRLADVMEAAANDTTPAKIEGSTDEVNAAFFEASRHKSWDALVAEAADLHQRITTVLEVLPDEALTDPNFRPWMSNFSLLNRINGSSLTHAMLHFVDIYFKRGQAERATSALETMSQALLDLDNSPDWRGDTLYNLGCGYALTGQKDKAISTLRDSFRLNPGNIEWSKQDSDLNSLREEPRFQALYTGD